MHVCLTRKISAEPKHYSVDLSINHSFHLDRCYQFFYILSDHNPLFTLHIFFHHTTCESTCDTLTSSAANQGDNTVSVAQDGTATPGATG